MDDLTHYLSPPPRHLHWVLFGASGVLLLAVWLASQAYQFSKTGEAALDRAQVLRTSRTKRPPPKLSQADIDARKRWSAMQEERSFAWAPIFTALEQSTSPQIELLEFDPDKVGHQLTLAGEARNQQALVEFIDALAAQRLFSNVHLTHQQKKVRDQLETITFELKATIENSYSPNLR